MSGTRYVVVTDGACAGNGTDDARGGWAAIIRAADGTEQELTGAELGTTNNRMELRAVIEGLRALPEQSQVELVTDSSYVANAISKGWLDRWRTRGWRTADKSPVANRDLWEELLVELGRLERVVPTLVRGHAGHEQNERADRLAQASAADAERLASAPVSPADRPVSSAEGQLSFDVS